MPSLKRELDIYPADLLDMPTDSAPWEVAHLRFKDQEKSIARMLADKRMPFYLPQTEERRVSKDRGRDRVRSSHLALFPRYLFMRRVDGLRDVLFRDGRGRAVAGIIPVFDQDQLTAELRQIRDLQLAGATLTPVQDPINEGDVVQIKAGVFQGCSGVVVEERGAARLIVSISVVRRFVAVEFPSEMLKKVS